MKNIKINVKCNDDIIEYLSNNTDYSKSKIKSFFKYKKVSVNNKVIDKLPYQVKIDDLIIIDLEKSDNTPFDIIYEVWKDG